MLSPTSSAADALRKSGQSGRRILVIEDDRRFADILSELAREMDFECDVANTASDGLAMAASNQPNAIVLDINLPDFSGLGVLDQRSEEHTSELQSPCNLVCRLLLEKKKKTKRHRCSGLTIINQDSQ